jgi:uncharacterized protein DUF3592
VKKFLAARVPRDRVADVGAILSLALGLYLVAIIAVPLYRISSNPERAIGTVTRKDMTEGREGSASFTVFYSFKASSGREYTGSVDVDERTYEGASVGNTLEVQYAADEPSSNRAARASIQAIHLEVAGFVALLFVFFAYFGPWRWLLRWRGKPDPILRW